MFIIRSRDDEASLSLVPDNRDYFVAEVSSRGLSATARVRHHESFGLDKFFADIARGWRGWPEPCKWGSHEGELELRAWRDGSTHITIEVELQGSAPARWIISTSLVLAAGHLDDIAAEAKRWETEIVLPAHRNNEAETSVISAQVFSPQIEPDSGASCADVAEGIVEPRVSSYVPIRLLRYVGPSGRLAEKLVPGLDDGRCPECRAMLTNPAVMNCYGCGWYVPLEDLPSPLLSFGGTHRRPPWV